ncbi:MAG: hypothetical protein KA165_01210 [Saprospiraceae bacterium]|nr:hypothetical protein [Saprospiraceae bacterium]
MSNLKDKRTKEQIIKLLDNAIEQEEYLSEKIKLLETQLGDCQKKAADPRYELTEGALSNSKVSFRIDYYRTEKSGPLKGIIEHIPSREPKPFEGEGWDVMQSFIGCYLNEEFLAIGKKKSVSKKETKKETPGTSQPNFQENLVLPPTEHEKLSLLDRLKAKSIAQGHVLPSQKSESPLEQRNNSRLLERLRAEFSTGNRTVSQSPVQKQAPISTSSPLPQRLEMSKTAKTPIPEQNSSAEQPLLPLNESEITGQVPERRTSRLLERIRTEQHQKIFKVR